MINNCWGKISIWCFKDNKHLQLYFKLFWQFYYLTNALEWFNKTNTKNYQSSYITLLKELNKPYQECLDNILNFKPYIFPRTYFWLKHLLTSQFDTTQRIHFIKRINSHNHNNKQVIKGKIWISVEEHFSLVVFKESHELIIMKECCQNLHRCTTKYVSWINKNATTVIELLVVMYFQKNAHRIFFKAYCTKAKMYCTFQVQCE
jgi:hypothetical protein